MSTHEKELFETITESNNPELAVLTAIKVFAAFLERLSIDQEPQPVCPAESS